MPCVYLPGPAPAVTVANTEYTEFQKTYGIPYKRNSENTLVEVNPSY